MKNLIKILVLTSILISNISAKKIIKYKISNNDIIKQLSNDTIKNSDTLFLKNKITKILTVLENNGYPLAKTIVNENNDTIYCNIKTNKPIIIKNIYSYKEFPYLKRIMNNLKGTRYSYKNIIDNIHFIKNFNMIDTLVYKDLVLRNSNFADLKFYYKDSKNYKFDFLLFYKNKTIMGKIYFKNFNFFDEGVIFSLNFNKQNINYSTLNFELIYPYLFSYPLITHFKFDYKRDKISFTNFIYNLDLRYISYKKTWQLITGITKETYLEKMDNIYINQYRNQNFLYINLGFLYKKNNILILFQQNNSITKIKKKKYTLDINFTKTIYEKIYYSSAIHFKILTNSDNINNFNSIKVNEGRMLAFPFYNIWTDKLFFTKQKIKINITHSFNIFPFLELSYFNQYDNLQQLMDYGIGFDFSNTKQQIILAIPKKINIDNIFIYYNITF